jgi:predicted ATP-dependent serine protease
MKTSRFTGSQIVAILKADEAVWRWRSWRALPSGVVVIFVGHVTKEGAIAGPRVLEQIVDAVLYFEGGSAFELPARARDQEPVRRGQPSRRPTWRPSLRSILRLKTGRYLRNLLYLVKSGWPGEIRPVQRGLERIREAAKLGFPTMLVPSANKPKQGVDGVRVIPVDRVDEALAALRG